MSVNDNARRPDTGKHIFTLFYIKPSVLTSRVRPKRPVAVIRDGRRFLSDLHNIASIRFSCGRPTTEPAGYHGINTTYRVFKKKIITTGVQDVSRRPDKSDNRIFCTALQTHVIFFFHLRVRVVFSRFICRENVETVCCN